MPQDSDLKDNSNMHHCPPWKITVICTIALPGTINTELLNNVWETLQQNGLWKDMMEGIGEHFGMITNKTPLEPIGVRPNSCMHASFM
jgi:hypothetical protein